MIDIRIICTHDALKLAETLMRLLDAEEHRTRLSYGRQSLLDLELCKTSDEAVLLIWSHEAQSAHYMLEWAKAIAPERMIEIANAHGAAPRFNGHAPVIDFVHWRGERGGRSWSALTERLRTIVRANAPPKPVPTRAVLAVGLASVAAVAGAFAVRINDHMTPDTQIAAVDESELIEIVDPSLGVGGAVGLEPASIDEHIHFRAGPRAQILAPLGDVQLVAVQPYEPADLNDPSWRERLSAFNPLRRDDDEGGAN
jgi:hypothetical protein